VTPGSDGTSQLRVQRFDRIRNRYEDGGADFPPWFLDRGLWCDHPGQRHREHEGVGRPFL